MWARHVLFIGLVILGVAGLGWIVYPQVHPPRVRHFDPTPFEEPAFRSVVTQIDGALRQGWEEQKLQPAPRADDLAISRRLSLALTGTIPSVEEIRQLEAKPELERVQWWLSGIFQDRRYADYFAERLARSYVGTENGPFILFRRRRFVTWLSDELLHNRPYDQVVRELISSRGLWTERPSTNFITVTIEPDNKKGPNPERLAGRVTRAFLGIRLDCAQCHNHPFQKWTQHDFQGLAAFFGQVQHGFTGIYDGEGDYLAENRKTGGRDKVEPDVPFHKELLPTTGSRREQLAAWVTDPKNPYFARATVNRVWALMLGRPLVDPVDDLGSVSEAAMPVALQLLADDFTAHDHDLQRLIRLIAATEAFQHDSKADHDLTEDHERYWAAFPMTRLRPEQVAGSILQAASLETVNQETHIVVRLTMFGNEQDFIRRYGDTGDDEFDSHGGTIPQRLLMMNGQLVKERTMEGFTNASVRIATFAADERNAVETAYLAVLTRRPTPAEAMHFERRVASRQGQERSHSLEDLYWVLLNSTEFSWNH